MLFTAMPRCSIFEIFMFCIIRISCFLKKIFGLKVSVFFYHRTMKELLFFNLKYSVALSAYSVAEKMLKNMYEQISRKKILKYNLNSLHLPALYDY